MSAIDWVPVGISVAAIVVSGYTVWQTRRTMRSMRERAARAARAEARTAVPGAIVTMPKPMSKAEMAEFRQRWREAHAGGRGLPVPVWPDAPPQIDSPGSGAPDDPRAGLGPEAANEGR